MASSRWMQGAMLSLVATMLLSFGCQQNQQTAAEPDRGTPAPKPNLMDNLFGPYADSGRITNGKQATVKGQNFNSLTLNKADVVVLEKIVPSQVHAGEQFTYTINVFNTADYPVHDVVVTEYPAAGFEVSSTSPQASGNGPLMWNIPVIGAKDSMTIQVVGVATGEGSLKSCAAVSFVPRVCVSTDPSSAAIEVKSERESIVSPLKMTDTSIIPAMSGCLSPSSIAAIDSFFMIAPCDPGLIGTIITRDTGVATGAAGPLKCQSTVPMLIDGGPAKCSAMPPITFFVASALFLRDSIVENTERATILSSSVKK